MTRFDLDLSPQLTQLIRVKAAYLQLTPQSYLTQLIERDVADVNIPAKYVAGSANGKRPAISRNGLTEITV